MISGGHSPAFEAVCDSLAEGIGAERAVLEGRGHTIPSLGAEYNTLVDAISLACAGAGGRAGLADVCRARAAQNAMDDADEIERFYDPAAT